MSVTVEQLKPTVVLLVDQSGSMDDSFDEGGNRWQAVYGTLMEPSAGVVAQLQSQVRFGLSLYTSTRGFAGGECPQLTTVAPAFDNRDTIDAVYTQNEPVTDTPTGASLEAVATQLSKLDVEGPKVIVLATDGLPDTCLDPDDSEAGQVESLLAGQFAYDLGIRTFVISVGNDVGAAHLQEMANVGLGREPGTTDSAVYYEALNGSMLVAAFSEILDNVVSCEFEIDGIVDAARKCDGTVMMDGNPLECETDWDLGDASTLVFYGEACAALNSGETHEVAATWPCGVVVIP